MGISDLLGAQLGSTYNNTLGGLQLGQAQLQYAEQLRLSSFYQQQGQNLNLVPGSLIRPQEVLENFRRRHGVCNADFRKGCERLTESIEKWEREEIII
jgi:hypothetical protein